MQNKEIRVTAKTEEKAIQEAAILFELDPDQIEYRVVSQTSGGFFSFLGKKVEIAAWRKSGRPSRRSGGAAKKVKFEDRPEFSEKELQGLVSELTEFCSGICAIMADDEGVEVRSELLGNRLILDIQNDYLVGQITKNAKLAESLEHILRKKPRHLKRELPFRIFVDVNGTRRQRETDLIAEAKDLSGKVHQNKRPIVLNYKSSYDRKIIHMALDQDDRVYTKSIGSGSNRKLMILPVKNGKEGNEQGAW
ncbi:MAG: hypothetical protein CMP10_15100 [Zetaproteobacteria bacterium]|nr:hypothetical protein [Pseudobdellovibrionaceae bacterium]